MDCEDGWGETREVIRHDGEEGMKGKDRTGNLRHGAWTFGTYMTLFYIYLHPFSVNFTCWSRRNNVKLSEK